MKPLLVLCLGNEIITDDRFGYEVACQFLKDEPPAASADILFASVAGFNLLDLLGGRKKVLIVDTILTGMAAPGTLHNFPIGALAPSRHLTTSHQISLPTAVKLGRRLGVDMPTIVDVIAVEAQDLETLGEELTPPIRLAVDGAVGLIRDWIAMNSMEELKHE